MRALTILALSLGLTFGVAAHSRNAFSNDPRTPPSAAPDASSQIPQLPSVRPGPYLPLPPDTRPIGIPPAPSASSSPSAPPVRAHTDGGASFATAAPDTPAQPAGSFPTRESLEAARKRCRVELVDKPDVLRASARGERLTVALHVHGAASCVQALQSDQPWADVDWDGSVVTVQVAPNYGDARQARVHIANVGTSLWVVLLQAAGN